MPQWLDSSQYLQKAAVDHLLGVASTTMPSVYLAAFTSDPGEGTGLTGEVSGGNYGRKALTASMSAFDLTTGESTLAAFVQFALASAAWGTITHVAIMDSITTGAGNKLWSGDLETPITIIAGSPPLQFTPGQITIALSGLLTNYARKKIGDHFLGKSSFTMPTACDYHLFKESPGAGGSFANEANYGSYANFDNLTSKMAAATLSGTNAGIAFNNATVAFPAPTSGTNTIKYTGISDGAANLLTYNPLRHAVVVNSGDPAPTFPVSRIAVGMS